MSAFKALAAQASENITPGSAGGSGGSSSSGGAGGAGGAGGSQSTGAAGGGAGTAPSSTASAGPAEQTTNAAPGLYDASSQSLFGLTIGVLAAFFML
jgi:hypothetical protein